MTNDAKKPEALSEEQLNDAAGGNFWHNDDEGIAPRQPDNIVKPTGKAYDKASPYLKE